MITVKSTDTGLDWTAGGADRLAQNVRNIIRMWQGEAAFNRPMGVNREAIGHPLDAATAYLIGQVRENIEVFEPDVTVRNVRVVNDNLGRVAIEVDIDV